MADQEHDTIASNVREIINNRSQDLRAQKL